MVKIETVVESVSECECCVCVCVLQLVWQHACWSAIYFIDLTCEKCCFWFLYEHFLYFFFFFAVLKLYWQYPTHPVIPGYRSVKFCNTLICDDVGVITEDLWGSFSCYMHAGRAVCSTVWGMYACAWCSVRSPPWGTMPWVLADVGGKKTQILDPCDRCFKL